VWWHGRWYLAGRDLDRAAPRVFRLSRIVGEATAVGEAGVVTVPPEIDLTALVSASDSSGGDAMARIRVRHDRAIGLRRQTVDSSDDGDGWDIVTVPCPDPHRLAEQVLAYGTDAVLLAPPEAREAVVRRLQTLVAGRP
jgi:predicted DNA-binding transcriptional regulator YafY